jgi:hypothetical protein
MSFNSTRYIRNLGDELLSLEIKVGFHLSTPHGTLGTPNDHIN